MDRSRFYTNPFVHHDQDDSEVPIPEHGPDSPSSGDDTKMMSSGAPSPKKRKGVQKKVVSVPIGDVDGSKNRGETYPPSDSWAWRKYGQKPIKGSPYPRGYYRCSSSKGCPARKQVERSRVDPTTLIITYASEHNHPIPTTKHHHHNQSSSVPANTTNNCGTTTTATTDTSVPAKFTPQEELTVFATNHSDLELGGSGGGDGYGFVWFADDVVGSTNILESPICAGNSSSSCCTDSDVAMVFKMKEEDESLFADLGELPECSVVFRRSVIEPEETNRRCCLSAVPCCGSTG